MNPIHPSPTPPTQDLLFCPFPTRTSPLQLDDSQLVALAQAGDLDAADVLFSSHRPGFLRYALNLCGDHHRAEDLCQDACLKASTHFRDLDDGSAFFPWVTGFIFYEFLQHERKSKKMKIVGTADLENDTYIIGTQCIEPDHSSVGDLERLYALLSRRNAKLPPTLRKTADFMLNYYRENHVFPSVRATVKAACRQHGSIQRDEKAAILAWRRELSNAGLKPAL